MPVFFYTLFLFLYKTLAWLLGPFNPRIRQWNTGRKSWQAWWLLNIKEKGIGSNDFVVWMHASSLGEFEQGAPVLEGVKKKYPGAKLVVTFFSPSGYEVRKHYAGADLVGYLPFDHPADSEKFVDMLRPGLVLWVKYEYWYYTLRAISMRGIPLLLVSGIFRREQTFFKWYGSLHRQMLSFFTHFFLQTPESVQLAAGLILPEKMTVSGDTRFDRVAAIADAWTPVPGIEKWIGGRPDIIVAGSTWPSDEEEMVHFFKTRKDVKLILVPHSVDESMIQDTLKLFPEALRYSQLFDRVENGQTIDSQVLLIDNIGMLARLYKYARIAYVGGGFTGDGIHNVLEAGVYGVPVLHGPEFEKYAEAKGMVEAGASRVIESALELETQLTQLLHRPELWEKSARAALDYVHHCTGATQKILDYIQVNRLATNRQNF